MSSTRFGAHACPTCTRFVRQQLELQRLTTLVRQRRRGTCQTCPSCMAAAAAPSTPCRVDVALQAGRHRWRQRHPCRHARLTSGDGGAHVYALKSSTMPRTRRCPPCAGSKQRSRQTRRGRPPRRLTRTGGVRRCSCRPSLHCLLRCSKHQQVCRSLRTDGGRAVVSPRAEHRASTPMQ